MRVFWEQSQLGFTVVSCAWCMTVGCAENTKMVGRLGKSQRVFVNCVGVIFQSGQCRGRVSESKWSYLVKQHIKFECQMAEFRLKKCWEEQGCADSVELSWRWKKTGARKTQPSANDRQCGQNLNKCCLRFGQTGGIEAVRLQTQLCAGQQVGQRAWVVWQCQKQSVVRMKKLWEKSSFWNLTGVIKQSAGCCGAWTMFIINSSFFLFSNQWINHFSV